MCRDSGVVATVLDVAKALGAEGVVGPRHTFIGEVNVAEQADEPDPEMPGDFWLFELVRFGCFFFGCLARHLRAGYPGRSHLLFRWHPGRPKRQPGLPRRATGLRIASNAAREDTLTHLDPIDRPLRRHETPS